MLNVLSGRTLRERGAEDVPAQPLEAGAVGGLEAHTGVQAVPREARAPRRKRELLPPEHLHAPGALARPVAEGRLPEERGLLDHGLGVVALVGVSLVLGAEALASQPAQAVVSLRAEVVR